jgi:hypothetical protein
MRSLIPASLISAALALTLGGCSPEAPKLTAPHREKAVTQPVVPSEPVVALAAVREKLGAGQCRVCHRIQYDSWVKSGHARKALDCEGCHGNGSEYAKAEVMKDLVRAKANGLIFQTAEFCEKCHPTADATFLPKAHAHRAKAPTSQP